jgi:hypothetical protein
VDLLLKLMAVASISFVVRLSSGLDVGLPLEFAVGLSVESLLDLSVEIAANLSLEFVVEIWQIVVVLELIGALSELM